MASNIFATAEKRIGKNLPAPGSASSDLQRFELSQVAQLVLYRGISGSGKTTKAKVLEDIGYRHFEADMYFEVDGVYRYNPSRIREAHEWCKLMTRQALYVGDRVVVSNTFTTLVEIQPYLEMGAQSIRIVEADGSWENVHNVPPEVVRKMASRWERLPSGMLNICASPKSFKESAHV